MARTKKSRKVGQIGTPKAQWGPKKPKASQSGKPKKRKGNPSGSRHSESKVSQETRLTGGNIDPRVGSKKPIPLKIAKPTDTSPKSAKRYFSPAQELAAIENDEKLASLLDVLDEGKVITSDQQQYVDEKLARHKSLCELLGIEEGEQETSEDTSHDDDDPFTRFESIDINKLK